MVRVNTSKFHLDYTRIELGMSSQELVPSNMVARVIGSCSGFGRGGKLEGLDVIIGEDFGNLSPIRIVKEHVSNIIKSYFEQHSIMTQAQILHAID